MENVSSLLVVLGGIGPLLGGMAGLLRVLVGVDRQRWSGVKLQAEVLAAIPQNGVTATNLERFINEEIASLIAAEKNARREWGMAFMAAVTVALCVWATVFSVDRGGWWLLLLLLTIPTGAACGYGVTESLAKVPRDEKDNRIESPEK